MPESPFRQVVDAAIVKSKATKQKQLQRPKQRLAAAPTPNQTPPRQSSGGRVASSGVVQRSASRESPPYKNGASPQGVSKRGQRLHTQRASNNGNGNRVSPQHARASVQMRAPRMELPPNRREQAVSVASSVSVAGERSEPNLSVSGDYGSVMHEEIHSAAGVCLACVRETRDASRLGNISHFLTHDPLVASCNSCHPQRTAHP